ncbi:type II toxin-antitoxin system RelE family toxin [Gracilibacillus timonensis]|uniref:type II toxin-antitoxin system RelE family toxin n=1 Tax=Gracilibacillus timonensis TaxID=1816696 RepID=UPI0008241652|nr:type II toxin-antitoxin system RelE/ParE family toxin [Gracilibacillus timonensis]
MNYLVNVAVSSKARKYIKKLDKPNKKRMIDAIEKLQHIPPEGDISSLKGNPGILRCRVGDWRIVFEQNMASEELVIHAVDSRCQIYKHL